MKEHKIGEIFEFGGEWYQCMKGNTCNDCAFYRSSCGSLNGKGSCSYNFRKDATNVIFKKLKKVGESPCKSCYFGMVQLYKLPYWNNGMVEPVGCHFTGDGYVLIEIKQNKEDMEQEIEYFGDENGKCFNSESIEKNLKPFNLDTAKQGKPVCTRDGCKARIICFDRKDNTPIVALIERVDGIEILQCFYNDGKCFHDATSDNDLMMLPEKKEGWVNVYKGIDGVTFSKNPYTSKDEAIKKSGILFGRIDTIKVSWEE